MNGTVLGIVLGEESFTCLSFPFLELSYSTKDYTLYRKSEYKNFLQTFYNWMVYRGERRVCGGSFFHLPGCQL